MLPLLISPLGKWVTAGIVAIAIFAGIGLYLHNVRLEGARQQAAQDAIAALKAEETVAKHGAEVDAKVAKDPNPQDTLKREWERKSD